MASIPKPFSRPSISISSVKRDWREISVYSLEPGDIARGWGEVSQVADDPDGVVIIWKNGTRSVFAEGDKVTAFVKV